MPREKRTKQKPSTHAKLDKDLRLERMANALKGQKRSRHFDEWRNEHIVAWFLEMDLEEYVPAVLASKVDGLLLLNMDEDDFRELGITKRLHQRKIDIALKKYKLRYERREAGGDDDIDIQAEEVEGDMDESDKSSSEESYSDSDEEEEKTKEEAIVEDGDDLLPTEEELLELKRDRDNIQIDVLFPGGRRDLPPDRRCRPVPRVCKIADTGKEVENTRKAKQTFEFVLGIGQVIKGWDRGVLQMSFGERSKLTISAERRTAEHGVKPLIPPYAKLIFDLELLRWHPRPHWSKPLIQQPGLTEYPYEDPRAAEEEAGDDDEFADLEDDEVDGGDLGASDSRRCWRRVRDRVLKNTPDVAVAQRLDRTRPVRQGRHGLAVPGRGLGRGRGDGVVHGGVDDGAEHANGRGARGLVGRRRLPALLGGQQPRADAVPPVEREALAALDVRVVGFEIRGADVLRRAVDDVVRQAPGRREFLGEDRRTLSFVPQSSQVPGKPRIPLREAPRRRTRGPARRTRRLRRFLVAGAPPRCAN